MPNYIDHLIAPVDLLAMSFSPSPPLILDVRRQKAFKESGKMIAGARWMEHLSVGSIADQPRPERLVVTYCVHGHQVSQSAAAILRLHNLNSVALKGGIEGWTDIDGPVLASNFDNPPADRQWVTCCQLNPDEVAACWLIRRYLSRTAPLHFVERDWIGPVAEELGAIPITRDLGGDGRGRDAFESLISYFDVHDPELQKVSRFLRSDAVKAIHKGLSHLYSGADLVDEFGRVCDALVQAARDNPPSRHTRRTVDAARG